MFRFFAFFAIVLSFLNATAPFPTKTAHMISHKKHSVILYIRPSCPYCVTVLHALDSLNSHIPIKDISSHPEFAKELVQIGGKRQVPCLIIDGKALYESREIIKWLQNNAGTY